MAPATCILRTMMLMNLCTTRTTVRLCIAFLGLSVHGSRCYIFCDTSVFTVLHTALSSHISTLRVTTSHRSPSRLGHVSESPRSYPLSVILTTSRSSTRSHRTRSASKTAPSRSRPSELPHTRRIAASPLVPSCAARRILSERHRRAGARARTLAARAERASECHQSVRETARHRPDKAAGARAVR